MTHDLWTKNFSVRIDDYDAEGNLIQNIAEVDTMDSDSANDQWLRTALLELVERHKEELYELYRKEMEES